MALLPSPIQGEWSTVIGSPTVAWNAAGDSCLVTRKSSTAVINGVFRALQPGWSRLDVELLVGSGAEQATARAFAGIALRRSSTGRIMTWTWCGSTNSAMGGQVQNWTDANTRSGFVGQLYGGASGTFFRLDCDGTNVACFFGDDWDGIGYQPATVVTLASFLGGKPDQVGVICIPDSLVSSGPGVTLANLVGFREV